MSQGKYSYEIIQNFHMDNFQPMDKPLPTNWRKDNTNSGEEVDATIYRQLVGSLMYLVNRIHDMCYAINQLSQAMVMPTKLY